MTVATQQLLSIEGEKYQFRQADITSFRLQEKFELVPGITYTNSLFGNISDLDELIEMLTAAKMHILTESQINSPTRRGDDL